MKKIQEEKILLSECPDMGRTIDKLLDYGVREGAEAVMFDFCEQAAVFYKFFDTWKKVFDIPDKLKSAVGRQARKLAGLPEEGVKCPQTIKFKKVYNDFKAIFQVSDNPLPGGEKIFFDICLKRPELLSLRRLGLEWGELKRVENNLRKRSGLSLVLGTFNSGRTTSLYAFLDYLNQPELNICTIESEVDSDISFANQTRLDPKAGFDHRLALDSIFKQDPDVIMIGEITDQATSEGALRAALRGLPVLAGIYSRDVVAAIQLLRDLNISMPLFAKAVNMFVNQRVVKKICHHCITKDRKNNEKIKELKKSFSWKNLLPRLKEIKAIPDGIKSPEELIFYKGQGCERCSNTGFSGSIGAFEILEVSSEVKALLQSGHLSGIKKEIESQKGFYIKEDALLKALNGITTLDEVLRLVKE